MAQNKIAKILLDPRQILTDLSRIPEFSDLRKIKYKANEIAEGLLAFDLIFRKNQVKGQWPFPLSPDRPIRRF